MTVGSLAVVGTFTVAAVPVSTWVRYASWTACVDLATSMPWPLLPYTGTALPGSNLIVPSLAPALPAACSSAARSFSSSTGMTGSTTRFCPNSEPTTDTGL